MILVQMLPPCSCSSFNNDVFFDLTGVIVTNVREDGTLPPHVEYKIRQNATFTHTTKKVRPSYWFPGPMNWGYNYYQYGFVWIQVNKPTMRRHSEGCCKVMFSQMSVWPCEGGGTAWSCPGHVRTGAVRGRGQPSPVQVLSMKVLPRSCWGVSPEQD